MASSTLIGTAPDQVPTNGDLGDLAFQNKESVEFTGGLGGLGNLTITELNKEIPLTAVKVFVYDTSTDSDGGAWRQQCKHTSWYNEELNTSIRGSKREFPSVAVIVATSDSIIIYDGDEPDLPMWMVFQVFFQGYGQGSGMLGQNYGSGDNSNSVTGITAVNGQLWISKMSSYQTDTAYGAINFVNFINDTGGGISQTAGNNTPYINSKYLGDISERNVSLKYYKSEKLDFAHSGILYNGGVDIASTVLPNATIDPTTKLPRPTIAIATYAGLSVIKDNGTVVNLTTNNWASCFGVKAIGKTLYAQQGNYYWYAIELDSFNASIGPVSDKYGSYGGVFPGFRNVYPDSQFQYLFNSVATEAEGPYNFAVSVRNGYTTPVNNYLQFVASNNTWPENGLSSFVTDKSQSGWMVGNTRFAILSSTTPETIASPEVVTNGTFDSNITGWSTINATLSHNSGKLRVTGGQDVAVGQVLSTIPNKKYVLNFEVVDKSASQAGVQVINGSQVNITAWTLGNIQTTGKYSVSFTASSTATSIIFGNYGANTAGSYVEYDNISVRLAEQDRSIKGADFQIIGTLTKSNVAPNSELVAYSGFSSGNYIKQTYDSSLNIGSGGYSVMFWAKTTSGGGVISRGPSDVDEMCRIRIEGSVYGIYFDYGVSSQYCSFANAVDRASMVDGTWKFVVCHVSAGGLPSVFVNGRKIDLNIPAPAPASFTTSSAYDTYIGCEYGNTSFFSGSLALLRFSSTIPSVEQIVKIYNDEKALFSENAKCTLYGSAGNLNALAFDRKTKLLHAGTNSGRSVFKGLQRIENTTTPVGASISASNELVVEE